MKKQSPAKQGKMSLTYTKTNKKTGKTTTNKNKFESNNSLVAPNNPNKNKIESNNSLVAPNNPNKTSIKNFLVPIGKSSGKSIIKPAVGKMKAGPFKMKGFTGFKK